ncbi:hypothetical protein [Virgibacillus sp. DJP39]|uniref:hypothetical protein n=1 Tax=Virgibacillus sp. DJP39 TaxID=3409790 RepID=UPI003BB64603
MIISHDFDIGLLAYEAKGKENDFPIFRDCPCRECSGRACVQRNGYYCRNGINEEEVVRIPICRLICLVCETSFSILPDFLIPYYQHTLHTVLIRVYQFLQDKKPNGSRQLLAQHLNRYFNSLHWIHSFFMGLGNVLGFSEDRTKEAIKYMKMIQDFDEATFLRRSWGHLSSYFMAH